MNSKNESAAKNYGNEAAARAAKAQLAAHRALLDAVMIDQEATNPFVNVIKLDNRPTAADDLSDITIEDRIGPSTKDLKAMKDRHADDMAEAGEAAAWQALEVPAGLPNPIRILEESSPEVNVPIAVVHTGQVAVDAAMHRMQ